MSYSFQFKASTKEEARATFAQEFDAIVAMQPAHAKDYAEALANFNAVVDLLSDDETQVICVACHGSISYYTDPEKIMGAQISASAWHVPKGAA